MRIQQTDRILKESRYARHSHEAEERANGRESNVLSRAWRAVAALPARVFRRNHD
jgi:hypothetical protein